MPDWLESFQNPDLPAHFAEFAHAFATRYPDIRFYTPVNEIYIAALFSARLGWWNERLTSEAAFVTAVEADGEVEAAEITFAIGRHALADLSLQYRVKYGPANRLADDEFDRLYDAVEHVVSNPVGREEARRRLTELRRVYEPKAQGLASWLALDLPPWVREEDMEELMRLPGVGVSGYGRDLVGQPARRKVRQRDGL